jgi:glycosyltransferase involved in cell wall biosynthesis
MIIYIVDFPIEGDSGKNKATREKSKALELKFGTTNFDFIYPKASNSRIQKLLKKITFDLSTFRKILFNKSIDVVIQRVLFMPATRFLLYIKGVKVISEYHADFKEEIPFLNKSKPEKAILYLLSWFYNFNYKLSDGIIYNHPHLKNKFDKVFKKPSIYSYNGSNVMDFNIKSIEESRHVLGISKKDIIFLFLGSVSKWHGVDYLIDIFNTNILSQNDNIKLYIVGGNETNYVKLLKQKSFGNANIIFKPAVDNEQANNYINSANYCLLPVKQLRTSPGSPLKLYDYIACGKPVITQSDVLGYSDEIENYDLGYTLDFRLPEQAAFNLISYTLLLQDEYFLVNNRKVAVTKVSWSNRIDNWHSFILSFYSPPS